jgi:cysteinyl-tRNA synthetase
MDDDFNTPEAIAVLQGLARELNVARDAGASEAALGKLAAELRALGGVLGFLGEDPARFLRSAATVSSTGEDASGAPQLPGLSDAEIDTLVAARIAARKARNFPESDRIRDLLVAGGVLLEDKPGGITLWRRG